MKYRHFLLGLLVIWAAQLNAAPLIYVFISFSMPEKLLEQTIKEATHYHAPVLLNGLYKDSMQETTIKLFELTKRVPNASIQIDPTAFENFGISQVPAVVVSNSHNFDVVIGNVTLEKALAEVNTYGDLRGSL
jgi:conjugal transfer pilus assembly protein TrbC